MYCEKPTGVDLAGVKATIAASKKQDPQNLATGFQQRYDPVYLEAYKRIQEGQIGDIVNARAFWIADDPYKRTPYPDPNIEKLRNWFCYKDYSGDFVVEQDCHNFDVLHWFLGRRPIRAVGMSGRKARTNMEIMDHLSVVFEFPNNIRVNYEANQISPPGFRKVREEFTGTKGVMETSRVRIVHHKSANDIQTIPSPRDITYDGIEAFLTRIETGKVENVGERSAISTLFGILVRTAMYRQGEAVWKKESGDV